MGISLYANSKYVSQEFDMSYGGFFALNCMTSLKILTFSRAFNTETLVTELKKTGMI